jgi:long-chain acyl-CoA synthetase
MDEGPDQVPDEERQQILTMSAVEQRGTKEDNEDTLEARWKALTPVDLLTIIYTSGTTGKPKGVMLTHENIISNILAAEPIMPYHSGDTCLSHLPLSHIFERTAGYYTMLYKGVTIAYAEDIKTVADNLLEVKPTVLISVPRLFEKIYTKIIMGAQSGGFMKRQIFKAARSIAKKAVPYLNSDKPMPGGLRRKYAMADKLVYSKIKEKTGGRIKICLTGGAPLAKEIGEFFTGFGIPLYEGYGLTETSPVVAVNVPGRNRPGTVGQPLRGVEVKIENDGEICIRGSNVMLGYYKNSEATEAAIINGWFHTGDIGILDEDRFLRITDRKKDLLVTSGGKNIAPQPLENALKLSPLIEHAVIIGDDRNFVSALIFPPWETVEEWAPAKNWTTDPEALVKNPEFIKAIEEEVNLYMKDFAHYEKVKKFRVLGTSLTVEGGELTPSMKIKRKVINERFAMEIDAIYST